MKAKFRIREHSNNLDLPHVWQEVQHEVHDEAVLDFAQFKVLAPMLEHGIVPRHGELLFDVEIHGAVWLWRVTYKLEPGRLELHSYEPIAGGRIKRVKLDDTPLETDK